MFSFSLWDLLWLAVVILVLSGLILVFSRTIKLKWYLFHILELVLTVYSLFYISWGFNYYRPGIEKRLGWERIEPGEETFRLILDSLIVHTNKSYMDVSASDYQEIDRLIENSYQKNGSVLGIGYPNGNRRPKTIFLSSYFAKSGISGYFGPLFNEVHINYYQLPMDYPFVLAHEKAHRGILWISYYDLNPGQ